MMRALLIISSSLLVLPSSVYACNPDGWEHAKRDIDWTIEEDAGAKTCTRYRMRDRGETVFDAIKNCNNGADKRILNACLPEACNYLKDIRQKEQSKGLRGNNDT